MRPVPCLCGCRCYSVRLRSTLANTPSVDSPGEQGAEGDGLDFPTDGIAFITRVHHKTTGRVEVGAGEIESLPKSK